MLASRFVARQLVLGARRWAHTALNPVTEQDVAHFSKFLAPTSIFSTLGPNTVPQSELSPYNDDWMGKYHGKATTVIKPKTTEEVSKIVKHCWERRIGIVPQGGNTGLVGGSVPIGNELILNLGSMSQVRSFDPVSGLCRLCFVLQQNLKWHPQEFWLRMLDVFCNH
jgi:(R)-2-hydroxyglutarate---pyruvate transhydrogenase